MDNIKKILNTKRSCFIISIFILISSIIIIYFSFHNTCSIKQNEEFESINSTNLKIKFFSENERYIFSEAVKNCQKLNADLWVVHDEEEWNTIIEFIKFNHNDKLKYGIWLNCKAVEYCKAPNKECENNALKGQRIMVQWPYYHYSNYSRLAHKIVNNDCIFFSSKDDNLWKSIDCINRYNFALCIK